MSRIALDAMGGDHAPGELVAGAVEAASQGVEVVLVGDQAILSSHLEKLGADLPVVHAPHTIAMGDDPARALREKPDSSVAIAARLVKTGDVDGLVSAGSTGAAMSAAAILIGRITGVRRPSIASIWPTPPTPTVVLDSGANLDVKAETLVQFAQMGAVAAEVFLGLERPRVGLLSNGEEKGKGRQVEREAHDLLAETALEFIGNVEGRDVATHRADVIVTDGFTGNVFLKAVEGTARMVTELVLEALSDLPESETAITTLKDLSQRLDPESYGGGHLLGVAGVVVIAHGSSTSRSVANALRMARDGADRDLVGRLAEGITSP